MKTTIIRLMVTMFTLAAVIQMTTISANAQEKDKSRNNSKWEYKTNKNERDGKVYRDSDSRLNENRNDKFRREQDNSRNDNRYYDRNNEKPEKKAESKQFEHEYRYKDRNWNRNDRYYELKRFRNYYHHPRFGHVIRRFEVQPMVLHHLYGSIFYHNGYFFDFHPGIGYIVVDNPFNYKFGRLPHNAARLVFRGHLYFRIGDLYFETHRDGYRLVPFSRDIYKYPVTGQIYISAKF